MVDSEVTVTVLSPQGCCQKEMNEQWLAEYLSSFLAHGAQKKLGVILDM